ncbi:MAG TPA: NFACT family protein [Thermomicrobiales bacterium]|nr:NFACT family protein [Thermomicrobiales bacterium]
MYDILTIAAIADELSATLIDGRIQRIGAVDSRTIAAEIYAGGERRALVVSASDRDARLRLADRLPSLDPAHITPFILLLRKYVRGGVIIGIEQPPLERIVRISIAKRLLPDHERRRRGLPAESSDEGASSAEPDESASESDDEIDVDFTYVHLVVEIMGRHSNLILVDDDGVVMESVKRVTAAMSRARPVWPRLPYTPPPARAGLDPRRVATAEMAALLAAEPDRDRTLWRALIAWLRGVSPQMAREIAFRALGDAAISLAAVSTEAAAALARETRHLVEPLLTAAWAPRVYRERAADGAGRVVAFSAVPMRYLAAEYDEEAVASISRAAALAEDEATAIGPERHAQRRTRLLAQIVAARERQQRRLAAIEEQRTRAAEAGRWRRWGETIYAWLWQIQPGQTSLEIDGESIPLDPLAGPKETAQRYFDQYRRARGAADRTPVLEEEVARELAYLEQMRTLTDQAAGFAELEALAAEWDAHAGNGAGPVRRPQAPKRPQPLLDAEGNAVFIGRSGGQNDLVTFDLLGPNDTWLHARGVAGSHVGIRWRQPGAERPDTIDAAARLAAWHSAARGSGAVEVDVAPRRHVRKIKGGRPGLVTYRHERTIAVEPASETDLAGVLRPA